MSDPLKDAARALRETTSGAESAVSRHTRSRVLAQVRLQQRRRVTHWSFGLPLAAILVGSAAWAATAEHVPARVQRVAEWIGLRRPSPASTPQDRRPSSPRTLAAVPSLAPSAPEVASEQTAEAARQDAPAVASEQTGPSAGTKSTPEPKRASAIPAPSLSADVVLTERELSLYDRAHREHFVDKDFAAALIAWDAYLKEVHDGHFVLEARYNRALCLVRLGRTVEAKQALLPFANRAYGNYRQAEAQALLTHLDEVQ